MMTHPLHLPSRRPSALAAALTLLSLLVAAPALAGRLNNGRVVFDSPLDLVEVAPVETAGTPAPIDGSGSPAAQPGRHQVVIHVPAEAGEPLEAVVITPYRGSTLAPTLTFDPGATEAFVSGQGSDPQLEPVDLVSVGGPSPELNQALVVLAQPVQPGSTLTVVLTVDDPAAAELHEVEITAYPAGADSVGQFLGRSQLQGQPQE